MRIMGLPCVWPSILTGSQRGERDSGPRHDGCLVVCVVGHKGRTNAGANLVYLFLLFTTLMIEQMYYFARDDRVYRAFVERLDRHKDAIQTKLGRRLRWQLNALRTHLDGRSRNYHVSTKTGCCSCC